MLRFELELEMLEGSLCAKDLPAAWRAGIDSYVGIVPPDDRDGCLQDVHWFSGSMGGAFQSYTIGNILSAQFYAAAIKAYPNIPKEIAAGEFETLHAWLRENLYPHGRKFKPNELVRRITGEQMNTGLYLTYLSAKYADIRAYGSSSVQDGRASFEMPCLTNRRIQAWMCELFFDVSQMYVRLLQR